MTNMLCGGWRSSSVIILVLLLAAGAAESTQFRLEPRRLSARQQLEEESPKSPAQPTGYPAAGEEVPEVPFKLPGKTAAPDNADDNNDGPKDVNDIKAEQPEVNSDAPNREDNATHDKANADDDKTIEEEVVVVDAEVATDGSVIAISNSFNQGGETGPAADDTKGRLRKVYQRFPQPHRRPNPPTSESFGSLRRSARLQQRRVASALD